MGARRVMVAWALVWAGAGTALEADTLRVPEGTPVHVRLVEDLLSSRAVEGARVDLVVARPVFFRGAVVIPAGAVAWGGVQLAKKRKDLRFDIEGVRLADQRLVKVRCSPTKTTSFGKNVVKVESYVGSDLGAPKGSEFLAYLDQDVMVEVIAVQGAPDAPAQAAATPPKTPAESGAEVKQVFLVHRPAAQAAGAAPAADSGAAVSSTLAPAPARATLPPGLEEYITVECFSDPAGADILIDNEHQGNTPSILKLSAGKHKLEYRLPGFKVHMVPLDLKPGSPIVTIRSKLEEQP